MIGYWRGIVREYRRLRALLDGASFSRIEAAARAVAEAERSKRHV